MTNFRGNQRIKAKYAHIVHDIFNSESGVCGYIAYLMDKDNNIVDQSVFIFDHPDFVEPKEWAERIIHTLWPRVLIRWDMCQFNLMGMLKETPCVK